jgi:phosphotransferase system HPr-like phosphotransfer protein
MAIISILQTVAEPILQIPATSATQLMGTMLLNRRAFAFASERLRTKYDNAGLPVPYENIVSNFELRKQDFIDYFQNEHPPSAEGLESHLLARLRTRADNWVHNRVTEDRFREMVQDFFTEYSRFYTAVDPQLVTLQVFGATNDVLRAVEQVKAAISSLATSSTQFARLRDDPTDDLISFLSVAELPYIVLGRTPDMVDIELFDPGSVFTSTVFICGVNRTPYVTDIDALATRVERHGRFAETFLVSDAESPPDIVQAAEGKGIHAVSLSALRHKLVSLATRDTYRCGRIAAEEFQRQLGVHDSFVDPECVVVQPWDDIDNQWRMDRESAMARCESFLKEPSQRVLVILGGYGAGKTTLTSELLLRHSVTTSESVVIYSALKDVPEQLDLASLVRKADKLARSVTHQKAQIAVVLDGIDELPNAMSPNEKKQNILRILRAASQTDKLILTARSSYFRGISDFWNLFPRQDDSPLWTALATTTPQLTTRPGISAIVLEDFNYDQVENYVRLRLGGQARESQPNQFLLDLAQNDPYDLLRRIARTPLYLSLLVSTKPWSMAGIRSIADVLRELIKYWLERDVTKGPSRWLLTTSDRYDLLYELAWWMYEKRLVVVDFELFDNFCGTLKKFSHICASQISLDLQTTGFLSSYGNCLYFMIPAFMDFLVAERFSSGEFPHTPTRPPTARQALIMLAMCHGDRVSHEWQTDTADAWLAGIGVKYGECAETISMSAGGILFGSDGQNNWDHINSHEMIKYRVAINAGLRNREPVNGGTGGVVRVLLGNRFGIHARPGAILVKQYFRWQERFGDNKRVEVHHQGVSTEPLSIMGLMSLQAGGGDVVDFVCQNSTVDEVEQLLESINGRRAPAGAPFHWVVKFHEQD